MIAEQSLRERAPTGPDNRSSVGITVSYRPKGSSLEDVAYIREHSDVLTELPPVFKLPVTRWATPWDELSDPRAADDGSSAALAGALPQ